MKKTRYTVFSALMMHPNYVIYYSARQRAYSMTFVYMSLGLKFGRVLVKNGTSEEWHSFSII